MASNTLCADDRSTRIIKELYGNRRYVPRDDDPESTGYDDVSMIQMEVTDLGYKLSDVNYLQSESGILNIIRAITPYGFECYIVSPSEHHTKSNVELIKPFIPSELLENILVKCGHKASGIAIRYHNKICFNWENSCYNFEDNCEHHCIEELLPIISRNQLISFPEESLNVMYDLYKSIHSDKIISSLMDLETLQQQFHVLAENDVIINRVSNELMELKYQIKPLIGNVNKTTELYNMMKYREMIISKMSIISSMVNHMDQLIQDYQELNELLEH